MKSNKTNKNQAPPLSPSKPISTNWKLKKLNLTG